MLIARSRSRVIGSEHGVVTKTVVRGEWPHIGVA
jgi:hypothetical protein